MKKITSISLIVLICFTVIPMTSASYEFDYQRPSLDRFTNSIFIMSGVLGSMNEYVMLAYNMLTVSRFYENKLYTCEAELQHRPVRRSGGGSSSRQVATIVAEDDDKEDKEDKELRADFTRNGQVDATDKFVWECNNPISEGATNSQGDADGDGDVDGADFLIWQQEYSGAKINGSEFLEYQALCNQD